MDRLLSHQALVKAGGLSLVLLTLTLGCADDLYAPCDLASNSPDPAQAYCGSDDSNLRSCVVENHIQYDFSARYRVTPKFQVFPVLAGDKAFFSMDDHKLSAWANGYEDEASVFDAVGEQFRPISQATVKHALFTGKKMTGTYDWTSQTAQWKGDIKKNRRDPIPLQPGDMSALLMNLAVIRDAQPGKQLRYRVVDNGRSRDYEYAVSPEAEIIAVEDLSYNAMRISRVNGGNDETIFWVVNGVPTPVRMLQREDGRDGIDLRLIEYQGIQ